jgi:hypothetical protein
MYDYIIYGGGPTGITLGLLLSKNYKVAIIESKGSLGGCWRVEWKNGLFTEHAPKVTVNDSENFVKLMDEIGLDFNKETEAVYPRKEKLGIIGFLIQNLTIIDIIRLIIVYIFFIFTNIAPYKTVKEWTSNFSNRGKKAIETLSILVSDIPEKVLMEDFIDSFQFYTLLKLKNPDKWIKYATNELEKRGVDIFYNTSIKSLALTPSGLIKNNLSVHGKTHILTLPPLALYELLINSDSKIKNNWENVEPPNGDSTLSLLKHSYYSSIGFQLHYDEKINVPKDFCWHCGTGGIAVSYNFGKGTIISCTIVDQRNIKNLDSSISLVIKNITTILGSYPDHITINNIQKMTHGGFKSEDTAFVRTKKGLIKPKGKLSGLYTVGSHNAKGVSTINKAISNAKNFFTEILLPNQSL